MMAPFQCDIDHAKRVVTIQGIRYAFDLFDSLGFSPIGTVLRVEDRGDGVVTLTQLVEGLR